MKITKKILIASLAISPLTTLAFVPNNVRQNKIDNFSYKLTHVKDDYEEYSKYLEQLKEFDIFVSIDEFQLSQLPVVIENKKEALNKKIKDFNIFLETKKANYENFYKKYLNGFSKKENININEYFAKDGEKTNNWRWITKEDMKDVGSEALKAIARDNFLSHVSKEEMKEIGVEQNNKWMLDNLKKAQIEIEVAKVHLEYLNNKLKLLEKIENSLLITELKLDYKESMKKCYSPEALKTLQSKVRHFEEELKMIYVAKLNCIRNGEDTTYFDNKMEEYESKLEELSENLNILIKTF